MASPDLVPSESTGPESAVKTVIYRRRGAEGVSGRVSVRTLKEMIARWELGPDDYIRVEGDSVERRVREYPALSPLDDMLQDVSRKVFDLRRGKGRRVEVVRELEMLLEYAEQNDRVSSVACLLLGCLRYAENPAIARGLFLKALERGYPSPAIARNNLAVAQIRLGDPAGRDNLILAANDPQRAPASLVNLARLLQHLQGMGEKTEEIASIKDLLRVGRAEWRKAQGSGGEGAQLALFLCDGDIPASFSSETRTISRAQGQIEEILAEGEDCLRQGRLEQAMAHAARASAEVARLGETIANSPTAKGSTSPLRFLSVRLDRLEKAAQSAKDARASQGDLEVFRKRLLTIEESLQLKVPPADLTQQAEILFDSARSEVERAEALNISRECQDKVARHLLETANELLSAGEKMVATGLLRRALTLESRVGDEIKLRLAGIRREELEEEIARALSIEAFDDARARIALLRTIHPIFEPAAARLEAEVSVREATALVEKVAALCGRKDPEASAVRDARRLFERARRLHSRPQVLGPIESELRTLEGRMGIVPETTEGATTEFEEAAPVRTGPPPLPVTDRGSFELETNGNEAGPKSAPS